MDFFPKPNPEHNATASIPHLPSPLQSLQFHLSHFKSHLDSAVRSFADRANQILPSHHLHHHAASAGFCHAASLQMTQPVTMARAPPGGGGGTTKTEEMKERFKGIPVYVLSDAEKNVMLVSGVKTGKSLALLCFKEEDARSLLEQMKEISPGAHEGSQVVSVGLNQVIQLKINDVAFRFVPDSRQILNAIKIGNQLGDSADGFSGVPIFLSRSLAMKSQNKKYRPAFLRKEDLEETLSIASQQQNKLNPTLRKDDVQVCVLEDIITDMKNNSMSKWSDLVFIPPGFDTSKHVGKQEESSENA